MGKYLSAIQQYAFDDSEERAQQSMLSRLMSERASIFSDAAKLDRVAASAYSTISPAAEVAEGKFTSKSAALDASIPEDHPQFGRASLFKDAFAKNLVEAAPTESASSILHTMVNDEAMSFYDKANQYKRRKDAEWGNAGEKLQKLPGYDSWLQQQREMEDKSGMFDPGTLGEDVVSSAALGVGLDIVGLAGALVPGYGKLIAPIGGFALGAGITALENLHKGRPITEGTMLAGLINAGIATGMSIFGAGANVGKFGLKSLAKTAGAWGAAGVGMHEVSKRLMGSEWYRTQVQSDSMIDKMQGFGAMLGGAAAGGLAADAASRAVVKGMVVPWQQSRKVGQTLKGIDAASRDSMFKALDDMLVKQEIGERGLAKGISRLSAKEKVHFARAAADADAELKGLETVFSVAERIEIGGRKNKNTLKDLIGKFERRGTKRAAFEESQTAASRSAEEEVAAIAATRQEEDAAGKLEADKLFRKAADNRLSIERDAKIAEFDEAYSKQEAFTPKDYKFQSYVDKLTRAISNVDGSVNPDLGKKLVVEFFHPGQYLGSRGWAEGDKPNLLKLTKGKTVRERFEAASELVGGFSKKQEADIIRQATIEGKDIDEVLKNTVRQRTAFNELSKLQETLTSVGEQGESTLERLNLINNIREGKFHTLKYEKKQSLIARAALEAVPSEIRAKKLGKLFTEESLSKAQLKVMKEAFNKLSVELPEEYAKLGLELGKGREGASKLWSLIVPMAGASFLFGELMGFKPGGVDEADASIAGAAGKAVRGSTKAINYAVAEAKVLNTKIGAVGKAVIDVGTKGKTAKELVETAELLRKSGIMATRNPNPKEAPIKFQKQFNVFGTFVNKLNLGRDVTPGDWGSKIIPEFNRASINIKRIPNFFRNLLDPFFRSEILYAEGIKPGPQLVSMQQAMNVNSEIVTSEVVPAILADVKGSQNTAYKIAAMYEPLVKNKRFYEEVGVYEYLSTQMQTRMKQLARMGEKEARGVVPSVAEARIKVETAEEINAIQAKMMELKPIRDRWEEEYEAISKAVAKQYPSARLAFAAEEEFLLGEGGKATTKWSKRKWMEGLMTEEEEDAAMYIRKLMDRYKERYERVDLKVSGVPYIDKPMHPELARTYQRDSAVYVDMLKGEKGLSVPYTKLINREGVDYQLVPDIEYIMSRYIPKAEKNIAKAEFWKSGWGRHKASIKGIPELEEYWSMVEKNLRPTEASEWTKWINRYYLYETINKIGFLPSIALKHSFKMTGTVGQFGIETPKHAPMAVVFATALIKTDPTINKVLNKVGIKIGTKARTSVERDFAEAFMSANKYRTIYADMGILDGVPNWGLKAQKIDNVLMDISDFGGSMTKYVEYIDRSHGLLSVLSIAQKKGLTGADAVYAIWDSIAKNNFMGGIVNPTWARDPTVRAAMMFQVTPYKILERRLVNAVLGGSDAIKGAVKFGKAVFRTAREKEAALKELKEIGADMSRADTHWKGELIKDAWRTTFATKDVTGRSYLKNLIVEGIAAGAVIMGGMYLLDADLSGHVFHLPFLKPHTSTPTLAPAPILQAGYKAWHEEDKEDFLISRFYRHYTGKQGLWPLVASKGIRIAEGDIPKIYKDSPFYYLFSVPRKKEK